MRFMTSGGKKTDEFVASAKPTTKDIIGRDEMTNLHFANFINAIQKGEALHSPIPVANVSVTMVQLSNIAWSVNRELKIDSATGHIVGDAEAMKSWSRTYQPGWEMKL